MLFYNNFSDFHKTAVLVFYFFQAPADRVHQKIGLFPVTGLVQRRNGKFKKPLFHTVKILAAVQLRNPQKRRLDQSRNGGADNVFAAFGKPGMAGNAETFDRSGPSLFQNDFYGHLYLPLNNAKSRQKMPA